jgi:signal transduction histidine kinase
MEPRTGHILVVDDVEMNRDMLARRLERRGYTVETAADGPQALDAVKRGEFDLAILDIMMPGMSGVEVLQEIRKQHSVTDLPVIMATARTESEDVVGALEAGANDYVTKPIDMQVLLARIRAQLAIRALSSQKDEFLAIASHDLKSPLTNISGYAKLILMTTEAGKPLTDETRDLLSRISRQVQVMARIITDFLEFQAIDDGQIRLEPAELDLGDVCMKSLANNGGNAAAKEIELRFEPGTGVPGVLADAARITQVLDNLVGNALKFSHEGGEVLIRTRPDGENALVEVFDSGPGLTDDDLRKVFRKYARLSSKPTGGEKSSGLGLFICKQLVDLHGGKIGCGNAPEGGSRFWFSLPAANSTAGKDAGGSANR